MLSRHQSNVLANTFPNMFREEPVVISKLVEETLVVRYLALVKGS